MDLPTPTPSDQSPDSPPMSMHSLNPDLSKSSDLEDSLLSPLFLLPGEDTSTSSSSGPSSQHSGSPRNEWALPGPMWTQYSDSKPQTLDELSLNMSLDFPSSLPQDQWSSMEMDTDISSFMSDPPPHISINPSALHHDNSDNSDSQEPGNYETLFQFTLSQPSDSASNSLPPFQLPTPKPGSMSSRSASPALSRAEHDSSAGVNPSDLSLLTQLGQNARNASGVMLAVPAGRGSQATGDVYAPISPTSPTSADSQGPTPKMPIPRLRPSAPAPSKSQFNFSAASHPTPPTSQSSSPPAPQDVPALATTRSGRPKTSHTTIERRYRTNLNARILALRRAVPALRILEKNTPQQTQGKGFTGASASKWDFDDHVNERGYVDGVKAAKKNSKGVVLGKAVEYIKALKRRELRLKREADGLRTLLSGLVGGPELLREWEREWRTRFGGEEADEVDEDEDDGEGEGDEGDDGGDDADSDEDDGRAKKRTRVEKKEPRKPKSASAPQAEKRKRGRPRKNATPDEPVPHLFLQPPALQEQPQQPSKILLAAFVFFNFFNPNATLSAGHAGTVLTHSGAETAAVDTAGWTVMQAVHALVSILLLISLVGPYLPKRLTHFFPETILFASTSTPPTSTHRKQQSVPGAAITDAVVSGDEQALRNALGADGSVYSVVKGAILKGLRRVLRIPKGVQTRQDEVELRGWRRLAEIEVNRGESAPSLFKVQTYLGLTSHVSSSSCSPSNNITLALLARSFATSTAADLWETARRAEIKTSSETLVLDLDIDDAAQILVDDKAPPPEDNSPVSRIAAHVVLERAKTLAARTFVSSVSGTHVVDLDGENTPDTEAKTVVATGRELGGALGTLVSLLDKVERCPATEVLTTLTPFETEFEPESSDSSSSESDVDAPSDDAAKDVRVLLLATLLYRRIFSTDTMLPSPPPSPTTKGGALHLALRRTLASAAFEVSAETEDARDKVVDMLAETRRVRFGGGLY